MHVYSHNFATPATVASELIHARIRSYLMLLSKLTLAQCHLDSIYSLCDKIYIVTKIVTLENLKVVQRR